MPKVIVIGAGFGGIAAALRMRKKGYEVLLVDKQDRLGGRGYVYERNGFTYDAGPTVITAPFLIEELFALFDRKMVEYMQLVPVEPWYQIRFDDGTSFRYGGTFAETLSEVEKFSPEDVAGYKKLFAKCKKIFDVGFTELGDHAFLSAQSMIAVAPAMIKLESYLTVYQLVSRYIKNEKLRQVFTFHPLLVGGNPFNTTSIYALIHYLEREFGVWYAMGGTGSIISGLAKLMEETGVEVQTSCTVSKIITEGGKAVGVETTNGVTYKADLVIANADPPFVYKNLLRADDRKKWTDQRVEQMQYSMGLFVIYFGTSKQYPQVDHHSILLGKRYKELLDDIFNRKILADDFSLYLHAPSRTDPSMAPPGHECFYVLAPVPNLQGSVNWREEGDKFANKILQFLESTILPGLQEHLVDSFFVTPEHFRDNLLTHHGTGFSVQPTLLQSAYFRFQNKSEDVDNLFFVGAGTHPGAGMPGVLTSAKVLDRLIPDLNILAEQELGKGAQLESRSKTSSARS
ncbi:MAG: phytoene desaturase family protein [Candidatus Melainabacteria bacterium]|nr:phytoene desaturase family protein [Candidatus Melainabacteria bacterium]